MNAAIELPPAPLYVTDGPEALQDADVVAQLMDGEKLRGSLLRLDERGRLIIRSREDRKVRDIPFSNLRSLLFSKGLPAATRPHPIQARGGTMLTSKKPQRFRIVYRDGKVLTGQAQGALMDEKGLHLFQLGKESRFVRLFVPLQVVKDHQLSSRIGEALLEEKAVSEQQLTDAVEAQGALRQKKIGEYLQSSVVLTPADLRRALDQQANQPSKRIGDLLRHNGLITERQLNVALEEQKRDRSKKLGDILVEMEALSAEALHITLARTLGIPFVKLRTFDIDPEVISLVTVDLAEKHTLIPLLLHQDRLIVAMESPMDTATLSLLRFTTGRSTETAVATGEDIRWAINKYYGSRESAEALKELGLSDTEEGVGAKTVEEVERMGTEKPVIRLVNSIIVDAISQHASDIHIRPTEQQVDLFFRLNGTLKKIRSYSKKLLPAMVSRIKILGRMNIAERRLPQDGQTRVSNAGALVDLRISVIPTVEGESVVIRILDVRVGLKSLDQIGFSERDQAVFADMLRKSYGMVLVTGPTGSGKSTTLYAALVDVKKQNVNIVTVEDPVEYHIDGIEQIQAYTAPGYTFAKALRHILRHDPDVIMIGEIRDEETGKIAIQSALTGHLVLSTLHTNDAASSVTRLLEMGVQPYLLSATLVGVVAQRLVRRNCEHCMVEEDVDPGVRKVLAVAEEEVFYRGKGCDYCNHTGYSGRLAVYELLSVSESLRDLLVEDVNADEIHRLAVSEGMVPLTDNAIALARQGVTSLNEVYRIRLE